MARRAAVVVGAGAVAGGLTAAGARRWWQGLPEARTGRFANGMEYARWGDGPRQLLWIPGGPGSEVPRGAFGRLSAAQLRPFLEEGFTVWQVTRKRRMPTGYTVADMADDHATAIEQELGGRVEAVVGLSYGGMVAQYLAARHPDRFDHVVVALCAGRVSDWGRDVDHRWALARAEGRYRDAGLVMAEYIFPEADQARARRLVGPLLARLFSEEEVPAGDLLVEAEAELAFDAREVLPQIGVPVLLLAAEEDLFFPPDLVAETERLIPDCTVVSYHGIGHLRAAMSDRLPRDVLAFVDRGSAGVSATAR